jgi:hypothetical protein
LEAPAVVGAFEVTAAGGSIRRGRILGLPVKSLWTDGVFAIGNALVIAPSLVQGDKQQIDLALLLDKDAGLERGAPPG